jgi:hypothetical protein
LANRKKRHRGGGQEEVMLKQGELKVFAHLKDKKYAIHRPDLAVYNDFNPCVLEIICHPSIYISIDTI